MDLAIGIVAVSGWLAAVICWFVMQRLLEGQTRDYRAGLLSAQRQANEFLDDAKAMREHAEHFRAQSKKWRQQAVWAMGEADRAIARLRRYERQS